MWLIKNGKQKLQPRFYGPYEERKRDKKVAYGTEIPNKGKIHDVFHVSCLKNKLGPTTHIQIELSMLDDEGKLVLEPECILEITTRTLCSKFINEYLVKWKKLLDEEATWESEDFRSRHLSLPIFHGRSISERDDL